MAPFGSNVVASVVPGGFGTQLRALALPREPVVHRLGIAANPGGPWVTQVARSLCADLEDAGRRVRLPVRFRAEAVVMSQLVGTAAFAGPPGGADASAWSPPMMAPSAISEPWGASCCS